MLDLLKGKNMRKLEIEYDFIDKIYESEGKYKIKRYIKQNPYTDAIISGFVAKDLFLGFNGTYTPEETVVTVTSYIMTMSALLFLLEKNSFKSKRKNNRKNKRRICRR